MKTELKVNCSPNELLISLGKETVSIQLSRISKVEIYKSDTITFDTIVLCLHCDERIFEMSEDSVEFDKVIAFLSNRLHGFRTDWRSIVLAVPFEEARTIVWEA